MGSIPGPGRSDMAGTAKPVYHNYRACPLEPRNCWAHAPLLLKPGCLQPALWNLRNHRSGNRAPQLESGPSSPPLEKSRARQQRPSANISKEIKRILFKKRTDQANLVVYNHRVLSRRQTPTGRSKFLPGQPEHRKYVTRSASATYKLQWNSHSILIYERSGKC